MPERARPSADQLLYRLNSETRARLRVYIGAAPGVGKTYRMLKDAVALTAGGADLVVGLVETYGRPETDAQLAGLEVVPKKKLPYKGVELEEMDVEAILARRPQICVVD